MRSFGEDMWILGVVEANVNIHAYLISFAFSWMVYT